MRLFVGVPLPAAVIAELSAITLDLRSSGQQLRWSAHDSWHITLQFLGNTVQEQYECTVAQLRRLRLPPIPIRLEGLGFFDRSGVFSACVRVTPELLLLQERVTAATQLCGYVPETRSFQPHITLARSKGKGLRELKAKVPHQPKFTRFVAKEFLLYESFLGSEGSRYEVRERFPLDSPQVHE
ncbi:RNA 2',3'-cyclic phosphodiesterase [Acidicapsa acidisoli]|uniref:RNA 2',3'-cyclic phosphodiesterase n=1 Tax=Acidicapsa acidisoli TaxID=1615681 RepID=UPI0021E0C84E|nr:RNA 2',3'-cyclic phosphodiesterase [Acidicapsa acidisoli]